MTAFTLIDETRPARPRRPSRDAGVRLPAAALAAALGWELKPEGLCRGAVCVPARDVVDTDGVDLVGLASALGRPLALDVEARMAVLGASAADRAARLRSLDAPDFTLPDVHGAPHTLSRYRGRKVFLLAYASG